MKAFFPVRVILSGARSVCSNCQLIRRVKGHHMSIDKIQLRLTPTAIFVSILLLAVWFCSFSVPPVFAEEDIQLPAGTSTPSPVEPTITVSHLVMGADNVVKGVLLLLVLMSIGTWGIVFAKCGQFLRAKRESRRFDSVFWGSQNLTQIAEASRQLTNSPVAAVYIAGHAELTRAMRGKDPQREFADSGDIDNVDRALKKAKLDQINLLERGATFLATTASAAPFIGLFGTVWGIMNAFIGLSHVKSTSIQAVAPGISEALIATAVGLFAAIPAAVAYNYFMQQIRVLNRSMDTFSNEFLNIARRHFFK